jgi:hypothetical protein
MIAPGESAVGDALTMIQNETSLQPEKLDEVPRASSRQVEMPEVLMGSSSVAPAYAVMGS